MTPCSVSTCPNRPTVIVTFAASGAHYRFCQWHGYRNGKLRWAEDAVSGTEKIPR